MGGNRCRDDMAPVVIVPYFSRYYDYPYKGFVLGTRYGAYSDDGQHKDFHIY
jgi:hypothetical protein